MKHQIFQYKQLNTVSVISLLSLYHCYETKSLPKAHMYSLNVPHTGKRIIYQILNLVCQLGWQIMSIYLLMQ